MEVLVRRLERVGVMAETLCSARSLRLGAEREAARETTPSVLARRGARVAVQADTPTTGQEALQHQGRATAVVRTHTQLATIWAAEAAVGLVELEPRVRFRQCVHLRVRVRKCVCVRMSVCLCLSIVLFFLTVQEQTMSQTLEWVAQDCPSPSMVSPTGMREVEDVVLATAAQVPLAVLEGEGGEEGHPAHLSVAHPTLEAVAEERAAVAAGTASVAPPIHLVRGARASS